MKTTFYHRSKVDFISADLSGKFVSLQAAEIAVGISGIIHPDSGMILNLTRFYPIEAELRALLMCNSFNSFKSAADCIWCFWGNAVINLNVKLDKIILRFPFAEGSPEVVITENSTIYTLQQYISVIEEDIWVSRVYSFAFGQLNDYQKFLEAKDELKNVQKSSHVIDFMMNFKINFLQISYKNIFSGETIFLKNHH